MSGSITQEQLETLHQFLVACKELSMTYAVVDGTRACAAMEDKSAVIIYDLPAPLFSGPDDYKLGLTRIPILVDRLGLVQGQSPALTLSMSDKKKYYTMLNITTDTHAIEFRFADPDFLSDKVPKNFKGEVAHTFTLSDVQIKQLLETNRAFQPDRIWFHVTPKGTRVDMFDAAVGDKVSIQLSKQENVISSISYKYDASVVVKLINQKAKSVELALHTNGLLKVMYKGVPAYALRKETSQ